jgi:predicted AlkP superfamily pyrophosphatase or phosphodiesterase
MLTGKLPQEHGIVANGWLFRDTMEVRFWQQSNRLLEAPPVYQTIRRQWQRTGRDFRCAKLFWWFNQGADVAISVTPKPHYGADGSKLFAVAGTPVGLADGIEARLGPFPFHTFWGPLAGRGCTRWIAAAAAFALEEEHPHLTLVYLPHLDYDPQRFGPAGSDLARLVRELDEDCGPLLDMAARAGARVWLVSEYGHCNVTRPTYPNRLLREAGLLSVRMGPFGETLDTFGSRAFAVCDHQVCHVYVANADDVTRVKDLLESAPEVQWTFVGSQRNEIGLDHPRAGEIVAVSRPEAWFAYPYWLDERSAPDFARTVDIHRKPGFDPCELFFDPRLLWPKGRMLRRLVQKKLGWRTLFDVVPTDATLVRGSHGRPASDPLDQPIIVADAIPADAPDELPMTVLHDLLLEAFADEGVPALAP